MRTSLWAGLAAAMVAASSFAPSAAALARDDIKVREAVHYDDLDVATGHVGAEMYARIVDAANRLCVEDKRWKTYHERWGERRCVRRVVRGAVRRMKEPMVLAAHRLWTRDAVAARAAARRLLASRTQPPIRR